MKKLYVIVSPDGKTQAEIDELRERIRAGVEEGLSEETQLVISDDPDMGIAGEISAIMESDIVVSTEGAMLNKDCRICNHAAYEYLDCGVYEEDWVEANVREKREYEAEKAAYEKTLPILDDEPSDTE